MKIYQIKDYLKILKKENLLISSYIPENIKNEDVLNISYNSKDIKENTLFVCKGIKYKPNYLEEAIKKGILCYMAEEDMVSKEDYPHIIVSDIRASLSIISILYYNNPEEKLTLVGITGTKGKSTTAYYFKSIMDTYLKHLNKKDTAIVSSIDVYDGIIKEDAIITCPESLMLQKSFYNASISGIENFIMEASSQAIKFKRIYGINYNIGVFLNISEDHISKVEHQDYNDYFYSKLALFKQVKNLCLNLYTDRLPEVLEASKEVKNIITFSTKNKMADIYAYNIKKLNLNTIKFMVRTPSFENEIILSMPGLFNVENALAAISIAEFMHIPYKNIYNGLKTAKVKGRMESYITKDNKVIVIVDYAHNKLSFEKLYKSVKEEYPNKKIVTVFGCPGNKAENRRRDLGLLAGKNSTYTYLTTDDPGLEDVNQICKEIAFYIEKSNGLYEIIPDREEAIKKAILNNPDSIILVAGKGNEKIQKYGTKNIPYKTDAKCVKNAFKEYESSLIS